MKTLSIIALFFNVFAFGQEMRTISLRTKEDMPQDTYVRIMKTADSLYDAYQYERFQFEKADGSCCEAGLKVILSFYKMALTEQPKDEDALSQIAKVKNHMEDEQLLYEEVNYGKILQKADFYMQEESYDQALKLYYRARELKPGLKAIKKKIKYAKKSLKKSPNS